MPDEKLPGPKKSETRAARPSRAHVGDAEHFGEVCGGSGGVPYSVLARSPARITHIRIWHRQYVDGIQLDTNEGALPRIGGTGRHRDIRQETFELLRDEFITGVSVEYWTYIDRITFHTNQRSFGPFGGEGGRLKKELHAPPGRFVVGFEGRHWEFIDSIQLMVSGPGTGKTSPDQR